MTPPNEADAKVIAEKLLKGIHFALEMNTAYPTYMSKLNPEELHAICARLFELEKLAEVNWDKWNYKELEEQLDALKAELKAANERCGKLEEALNKLNCVSSENNWVKKLIEEALRPAQQREGG